MDKNDKAEDVKSMEHTKPEEAGEKKSSNNTVSEKKSSNKTLVIVLVVVGALILVGVGGTFVVGMVLANMGKSMVENATGTTITTNGGSTTIQSKDGTSSISTSASLPDGFPSSVPLYSGQTIVTSSKYKNGEDTSWSVTAETNDSAAKTVAGIKSLYSGWQQNSEAESDGTYSFYYTKGDLGVIMYVSNAAGKSTITYSVQKPVSN